MGKKSLLCKSTVWLRTGASDLSFARIISFKARRLLLWNRRHFCLCCCSIELQTGNFSCRELLWVVSVRLPSYRKFFHHVRFPITRGMSLNMKLMRETGDSLQRPHKETHHSVPILFVMSPALEKLSNWVGEFRESKRQVKNFIRALKLVCLTGRHWNIKRRCEARAHGNLTSSLTFIFTL